MAMDLAGVAVRTGAVEQMVYERVALALGYSRNSEAMRDLARALPLAEVRASAAGGDRDAARPAEMDELEALYLGTAGLLPSQRHLPAARRREEYAEALERAWQEWQARGRRAALRAYRWDFGRSRPENAPARRVVALVHLALRWPEDGLLAAAAACLRKEPAVACRRLAGLVALPAQRGYWADHWDLGVSARAAGEATALVGPSRAADVVVNVLLPAVAAHADAGGDAELARRARGTFAAHPPLAENWITRLVRERTGLDAAPGTTDPVDSAAIQQGLIAIYEGPCAPLRCAACPLSGATTGAPGRAGV
jgi:hypothetical protein